MAKRNNLTTRKKEGSNIIIRAVALKGSVVQLRGSEHDELRKSQPVYL